MKLRQTHKTSQARRGQVTCKVEPINVFTCDESRTKPCGEFVYLGTQIDPTCSATPEVRRRCGIACAVFDTLSTLWRSSSIATDVKGHLYCALVLSVMCFYAEVWPISNTDAVHLEGVHFRLLRRIVVKTPEEHVTRDRTVTESSTDPPAGPPAVPTTHPPTVN